MIKIKNNYLFYINKEYKFTKELEDELSVNIDDLYNVQTINAVNDNGKDTEDLRELFKEYFFENDTDQIMIAINTIINMSAASIEDGGERYNTFKSLFDNQIGFVQDDLEIDGTSTPDDNAEFILVIVDDIVPQALQNVSTTSPT
jgi:hypothetical protein